jgi:hypothetical protein
LLNIPSLVLQLYQFHLLHCSDYLLEVGSYHIAMEILPASLFIKMLNILRQAIVYAASVLYDWEAPYLKVYFL